MSIFNSEREQELREKIQDLRLELRGIRREYDDDFAEQKAIHLRRIEQLEWELENATTRKIKELENRLRKLEMEKAKTDVELRMTRELLDINADVVDVKDLVEKLINKLPDIDLRNLSVTVKNDK